MASLPTKPSVPMVGSLAPDFALPCTPRGGAHTAALADYRGHWLMLVFYPRDFSLVCPTEMTAISARVEEFRRRGCEVLGVSTDDVETHLQWIAAPRSQGGLGGLAFPLAADPEGIACRAYGVYLEWQKLALRGLFFIDPNGVLQYSVVHNTSVGRRTDELLRVLDALQSGGLCPENWTPGAPTLDPTVTLGPGSVLAHYRFENKLGSGSFAAVYKARDLKLQRTVAIKVIQPAKVPHAGAVMAEARAAAALHHPHICTIYSVDDSEGVPLIVMEHVGGGALNERLRAGPLSIDEACAIGIQVAQGMAAAHAAGIVHGDLKPENILLSDSGAKITDFGLARKDAPDPSSTATLTWEQSAAGGASGTPAYMAPELVEGARSSTASDVFALGAVLFEMFTGRKVISGTSVLEVFQNIRSLDADRVAEAVPAAQREIVRQALRSVPRERPSMAQVAEELADSLKG